MAQCTTIKTFVVVDTGSRRVEIENVSVGNVVLRIYEQTEPETWESTGVATVSLGALKKAIEVMLAATGGGNR